MIEKANNRTCAKRYHKMTAISVCGSFLPEIYVSNSLLPQFEGDLLIMEVDLRLLEDEVLNVEEVFLRCCKDYLQQHTAFGARSLY